MPELSGKTQAVDSQPLTDVGSEPVADLMERWRQLAIPNWRRVLEESLQEGNERRANYARWMLATVLADPESQEVSQKLPEFKVKEA
ncbi:MAG: hypothetical protein PHU23_10390 [Dehalococcoidales bacterium]|nr:hypothetical protein [Dehalococcoidales bacterium]